MKKIVLVDDDIEVGMLFEVLTRGRGIAPTFIQSSLEALKFMSDNELDVAIVDLQMPYMDGIRLVKEVKKNLDEKCMRRPMFVCYTAKRIEGELERMVNEVGFSRVFTKPFALGDLLNEIGCFA